MTQLMMKRSKTGSYRIVEADCDCGWREDARTTEGIKALRREADRHRRECRSNLRVVTSTVRFWHVHVSDEDGRGG